MADLAAVSVAPDALHTSHKCLHLQVEFEISLARSHDADDPLADAVCWKQMS